MVEVVEVVEEWVVCVCLFICTQLSCPNINNQVAQNKKLPNVLYYYFIQLHFLLKDKKM